MVASNQQTITLTNPSTIVTSIMGDTTAINPMTGLLWNGGDVTITATPAIFGGADIASVTFTFLGETETVTTARTASSRSPSTRAT